MNRGLYVVIQGAQEVDKSTQIVELDRRLRSAGLRSKIMREPDAQTDPTSRNIRSMTQNPTYNMNTKTEVLLYNAARSQTLEVIQKYTGKGINCLVDQNYLSTLAVQYYGRADLDEYEMINKIIEFTVGDSEPDLTVVLDAPTDYLFARQKGNNRGEKYDNLPKEFVSRVRKGLLTEAKKRSLPIIDATLPAEQISEQIWELVADKLKEGAKKRALAQSANPPTQLGEILKSKKTEYQTRKIIDNPLETAVTNTEGSVYAFTEELPNTTIAAAMARLSRRADDMRVTLVDEFLDKQGKDEDLLKRVITAYGDDSVQQLATVHLVVEDASNLLTKKLEWGRLASYLEQSTRYLYFDEKDKRGNYKYHTPRTLDAKAAQQFEATMDKIFGLYSNMVRQLTGHIRSSSKVPKVEQDGAWKSATKAQACDAVRAILPVATKSTVGIVASGQALENLIMNLLADELDEAKHVGQQILDETRKVMPVFLERADKPDRGGATMAYRAQTKQAVKALAETKLPQTLGAPSEAVTLLDVWPRNELDLVPHMLFDHSDQSIESIKEAINEWSYKTKSKAFKTYLGERLNRRHKPGRALEMAHYSWELVCDYGMFRDLQRHRMVDDLEWQALTPRYGYDMPEVVEEAGLSSNFEKCFDLSYQLYSELQAAGYSLEAQYATLLGHKMRWKVTMNARESYHFIELRTTPQAHPGCRKLCQQMYEKLQTAHPLIAQGMIFVNKDEDPELSRLAAERYTSYKLEQLDKR